MFEGGPCVLLIGGFMSMFAICGLYKCAKCRMRDCMCIRGCLRTTGVDKFDDFEVMIVVHEALFTGAKAKTTLVRITAGQHTVSTNERKDHNFHETLSIFVEQGTENLAVELMDAREKRVLASLKLDPVKDLINAEDLARERVFAMKQKSKGLLNPRVKLSMYMEQGAEMEKGLLAEVDMSKETDMLLRSQLHKAQRQEERQKGAEPKSEAMDLAPAKEMSKIEMFAKGCSGPLDMFGSWGSREQIWIRICMPPEHKKYTINIYESEARYQKGGLPKDKVDLLRILSVQSDPARQEVFIINYVDANKAKKRLTFCRIDRARDVWVEMLTLLITMIREEKESKPRKR